MNVSLNWLKQYIDINLSNDVLSTLLTGCGLEVEGIEPFESVRGSLNGLIVGEVLETTPHPNADRLTLTRVNLGSDKIAHIVCGAPNVAAGQKVIVATPGTKIFPLKGEPFEIKNSKIRGEVSEGMICAEDEIGLGESHAGILVLNDDAVPGDPVIKYFEVENDQCISIGLTPNRADAASHIGVARDIRTVLNTRNVSKVGEAINLRLPDLSSFSAPEIKPVVTVDVEDPNCIRYSGLHITNVKIGPSPSWLQNKLRAIGLTPINNIVDITNFVLFETGQPLHAFDANKIEDHRVIVKKLPYGTKFTTLDGVDRNLNGTELMICDSTGGMCIAGVFGGSRTGVNRDTTEVFLESACFDSVSVRKTSKYHGLKTDASFRFERGTDPELTLFALKRAAMLICELAGGSISSQIVDVYPKPAEHKKIEFHFENFRKLTGVEISMELFLKILSWLDITLVDKFDETLVLDVPTYRVDVTREADIIEEVLRIYGYDQIPMPSKMNAPLPTHDSVPLEKIRNRIASYLVANGFFEVMSNSLYASAAYEGDELPLAQIMNPLSQDLNTLRFDMLLPLLDTVRYNRNRQRSDLRLFEFGKTYRKTENGYVENNHLSLIATGSRNGIHWSAEADGYSIYFLKSLVANLITEATIRNEKLKWDNPEDTQLDTAMRLKAGKKEIVKAGLVKRSVMKKHDLDGVIWYADINLDAVNALLVNVPIKISEPPRFPEVRRDLSMILSRDIQYGQLEQLAYETERKILRDVNLFDVFEGEKIGRDKKSYALSFVLRDDEKTLTDKEIDKVMERLMHAYEAKLGAAIRKA